jgi:hypothetical protein
VSYRDDEAARTTRANVLIDEIAELERQKLAHAKTDERLEAARDELRAMQSQTATPEKPPGVVTHALVFAATACAAFVGYTLLF